MDRCQYATIERTMKWVVNITTLPALHFWRISHVARRLYGSIPDVGYD